MNRAKLKEKEQKSKEEISGLSSLLKRLRNRIIVSNLQSTSIVFTVEPSFHGSEGRNDWYSEYLDTKNGLSSAPSLYHSFWRDYRKVLQKSGIMVFYRPEVKG
jgi:hypothetical protein